MFERILGGVRPTEVFRRMLEEEPSLTNAELAGRFTDYFENIDSLARQVIWHWQRPGGRPGLSDKHTDEELTELLRRAGYAMPKSET
ncbi:hypothetical protein P2318_10440 [Myxococcaceae bacterium GXIMD 01537]